MQNIWHRKIIVVAMVTLFFGVGVFSVTASKSFTNKIDSESATYGQSSYGGDDYTHTVFLEIATAQFCGPCHYWNQNVHNYYKSGNYDFEYVDMIVCGFDGFDDVLNSDALAWYNLYGLDGFPTSIFDGDYQRLSGNQPSQLIGVLNTCGSRLVADITLSMIVNWLGSATIEVEIAIQNNEATQYNGCIRACITEIISRYYTANDEPYHYGFLDYAFNKDISITPGGVYTDSVIWNGNEHQDNYGNGFGDISPNNIQVSVGVFNEANDYVDEVIAARPEYQGSSPEAPNIDGSTNGKVGIEYDYTFVTIDPDGDDVYYYIDWDDGSKEEWIGPYASGYEVEINHTWIKKGTYIIKAKAEDINGLVSPESTLTVTMSRDKVIYSSFLHFLQSHPYLFPLLQKLLQHLEL